MLIMDKKELFEYLKENLRIGIEIASEGYTWPCNYIYIRTYLKNPEGEEVLVSESKDSFSTM